MGKAQIIRRIHSAAIKYKNYFVGNTYMFVYQNQYIEVMFKKSSFLHLTGVSTNISAENFFEHALIRNGLRPQEVLFGQDHPYDLADKKTQYLTDLYKITITDVVIATDIQTMTFKYSIGITNLEFIICLGDDTDLEGRLKSKCKVPYSFRVEEIENNKFNKLYDVTHIFKKKTGEKKYNVLTYGNIEDVKLLPMEIQQKIELD
ncbi:PBECR4 domain-containing protein [Inconstantimicrobium porci]|uniref:PBECR4 domain-containing protein n=1 Tax=Inconstantimicrobium porci TaxID=2652291 RepID=UPI00240A1927|nr:PBECR4 domain-containing protein [Inconstantimicrobium porci]MDD6770643.1 PBECR4 domain-containing protein [Inconstantimicrobium porci]